MYSTAAISRLGMCPGASLPPRGITKPADRSREAIRFQTMNDTDRHLAPAAASASRDQLLPSIDFGGVLRDIIAKLRRRWVLLAVFVFGAVALAVAHVLTVTPLYTANGSLLIDPRVGQTPDAGKQTMPALLMSDGLTVDSQIRVLTSREVTERTARALGLFEPSESGTSLLRQIMAAVGLSGDRGAEPDLPAEVREQRRIEAVRRAFVRKLKVSRAGDTFVIDIAYTSPGIQFSADAVNTLMQQYLEVSSQQKIETAERTREWLAGRVAELRKAVEDAERAVAEYRRNNALLAPEGQPLPSEIALSVANEELVRLRVEALALDVQLQQLTQQIENGDIESVQVPPGERSQALEEFETRYADLQQEENELLLTRGSNSPTVENVRNRKQQTRDLIINEYRQIQSRLSARAESLKRQIEATRNMIADLTNDYGEDARKSVELRGLEREATAKRELYERLLEEYNSASQLLTFDTTSARVIARAVPPDTKSSPKSKQEVILGGFGGLVLGLGLIFLLESLDNRFRRYSDIPSELGLNYIGVIPTFRSDLRKAGKPGSAARRLRGKPIGTGKPAAAIGSLLPRRVETPQKKSAARRGMFQSQRTQSEEKASGDNTRPVLTSRRKRALRAVLHKFGFAVHWPGSIAAATLRALHVELSLAKSRRSSGRGMVVGLTSSVRDEGKTTTAFNLARFLAERGEKVAIIDMDTATFEMTRQLRPILPKRNMFSHFLHDPAAAIGQIDPIPEFGELAVIGNSLQDDISLHLPRNIERLEQVFDTMRAHFDYVIVDLPPIQGASETRLLAELCDTLIYVIRWGATPKGVVATALRQQGLRKDQVLGALYTRAPIQRFESYNRDEINDYHYA